LISLPLSIGIVVLVVFIFLAGVLLLYFCGRNRDIGKEVAKARG